MDAPGNDKVQKKMIGCAWAASVLFVALSIFIFACSSLIRSCQGEAESESVAENSPPPSQSPPIPTSSAPKPPPPPPPKSDSKPLPPTPPSIGLKLEQVKKTSIPMTGHWKEEDTFVDDEGEWLGSTCVASIDSNYVYLMTNRHCLGLQELVLADGENDLPEIIEYALKAHFPGNLTIDVSQFGWMQGDLDLAFLAVKRDGLVEGRDYVKLIADPKIVPIEGMDVVVVGSPINLELEGTHTFGRISAIRPVSDSINQRFEVLQTDAAINHGNSGGPLFLKSGDRWIWIGVASSKVDSADNLGMAIRVHANPADYKVRWFDVSPAGVLKLLNSY